MARLLGRSVSLLLHSSCSSMSLTTSPIFLATSLSPLLSSSRDGVPRRGLRVPSVPPAFENVNLPTKFRLPLMPKTPSIYLGGGVRVPKEERNLYKMMGEELTHNHLELGQYGIVALSGGRIKSSTFDYVRKRVGKFLKEGKSFAVYRVDPPLKPFTRKAIGRKMGGGKGSVLGHVTPVKAGQVILEVGGRVHWEEVKPWLTNVAKAFTFEAIAVNQEIIDSLNKEELRLQEINQNPYTFEWLVRNNMLDCHRFLSPKDRLWFGRFVYRDRTLNKKWNTVRQKRYANRK